MGITFSQFLPPPPDLTEKNLPSQAGKVFIVTGAASDIGYQLAAIFYQAGSKVYVAGRSEEKAQQAIRKIVSSVPETSTGTLEYLHRELDDLSTIKASVESFRSKESKFNVIWNNAGVSLPPVGSKSKQGHELQLATNCLGPYLFTQLLLPQLEAAAEVSHPDTVRVVWTSSLMVELAAPKGGVDIADLSSTPKNDQVKIFNESKVGNWFLTSELARDVGRHGILSVSQNPGKPQNKLAATCPQDDAADFWARLSPNITAAQNGSYIIPWGRIHRHRATTL